MLNYYRSRTDWHKLIILGSKQKLGKNGASVKITNCLAHIACCALSGGTVPQFKIHPMIGLSS